MNFSSPEFLLGRQRSRQWVPLITQQFRLRHIYQIIGFNLLSETAGSYYFTLHLTTMCAPFYTSEQVNNSNPKWTELELKGIGNASASCIVLRIWQDCIDGADRMVLTWGVNFSGLVYLGNKIVDIQPVYFKSNSVIFNIQGGFYTSHHVIKTDLHRPVPFVSNLNLVDTLNDKVVYRRIAIKSHRGEIQGSYNINKLRRLHYLQVEIRNKRIDVENLRDRINVTHGLVLNVKESVSEGSVPISPACDVRYAPQLLTMNSLNKMLQEKPTGIQKQEMMLVNKEIEIAKFTTRLLSQEKDKKTVVIRQLKQKLCSVVESNEERNSDLMENYHTLSREADKLKDYKRSLLQHREVYSQINSQLQQRRRRLLQELLFIFPIEKISDVQYTIQGIYLPNSDVLADCSDTGVSVALGYITHVLIMCSTFLQVPLRYPLTHYGSRSFITDNVSPLLPEKERDFPLFTRGKEKAQFTYAVYLLNKNLAQLRWLHYINTSDLKATLSNLLTFLRGHRESSSRNEPPVVPSSNNRLADGDKRRTSSGGGGGEKCVSLHSFGSNPNISDPLLDCLRHESRVQRSSSPTRRAIANRGRVSKPCRNSECGGGRGLSEILAIPEAFLNRRISSDSFRSYITKEKYNQGFSEDGSCCGEGSNTPNSTGSSLTNLIKITNGKEEAPTCDTHPEDPDQTILSNSESIEQGTDPLDPATNLSSIISKSIMIHSDSQLRNKSLGDGFLGQNRRISRSAGSYNEDDCSLVLRSSFEVGSEPLLNISSDSQDRKGAVVPSSVENQSQEYLEKWLEEAPDLVRSADLYPEEFLGSSVGKLATQDSPLMARTDALLKTKSFNLVKPKP